MPGNCRKPWGALGRIRDYWVVYEAMKQGTRNSNSCTREPFLSRPKSNLGITRVPVSVLKGVIREPKTLIKGNKGLLWVLVVETHPKPLRDLSSYRNLPGPRRAVEIHEI